VNGSGSFQSQELGVTYSAIGFCSLNTRGCVSVSNHSLTLPLKVLEAYPSGVALTWANR
jgi:hypothetical protein